MAELITIARPYARAAFETAQDLSMLPQWSRFLTRVAEAVRVPGLQALIGNPRVQAADLVELLLELAALAAGGTAAGGGSHLLQAQRSFLALLAHNQRLPLLGEIAAQYEALRAEAENVADVHVRSARQLTTEQSQKLQTALERRLGRKVRLHPRVDATLLGGAIVTYGDYVIDGSLRRRVDRLASVLAGA